MDTSHIANTIRAHSSTLSTSQETQQLTSADVDLLQSWGDKVRRDLAASLRQMRKTSLTPTDDDSATKDAAASRADMSSQLGSLIAVSLEIVRSAEKSSNQEKR